MDIEVPNSATPVAQNKVEAFFSYANSSKSKNSLRAYRNGWKKFSQWCSDNLFDPFKPPMDSYEFLIGMFISDMAKTKSLKTASIQCYLAAIRYTFEENGIEVDTGHRKIRDAMSGIRRELGKKQNQKLPLKTDAIKKILSAIDNSPIGVRDRAIILLGFAGAFRRSEIVGIDIEHLCFDTYGLSVYIPRSKTDQEGEGRVVDIPFGTSEEFCPVRAVKDWIKTAHIGSGALFVQVHKGGRIIGKRICGHTIARILKKRCEPFGLSENIAGHSLRAGHVTSAIKNGTPETWIMRQTGHTNVNTLRKYERLHREFTANSAANIGL